MCLKYFYSFRRSRYLLGRSVSDESSIKLIIILSLLVGLLAFANSFFNSDNHEHVSPRLFVSKPHQIPINYAKSLVEITDRITIDIQQSEYKKLTKSKANEEKQRKGKLSLITGEISCLSKKMPAVFYTIDGIKKERPSDVFIGVKLVKENSIFGITNFKLVPCLPTLHFTSWLFHHFEKYENLVSPEIRFIYLIMNGKNLGLYTFFEEYDTRMVDGEIQLPNYQLYEGTVFSFTNCLATPIRNEGRFLPFLQKLNSQSNDLNEIGTVVAIPAMARSFALKYFLTRSYNKSFNGLQLFYNNENGLIMPVGINWSKILIHDQKDENRKRRECDSRIILSSLFSDDAFLSYFRRYLKRMTDSEYLDTFFEIHRSAIGKNLRVLHRLSPSLSLDKTFFYLRGKEIYADFSFSAHK